MDEIRGIFPALVTPFTEDGKINIQAIEQLVAVNLEKGVSGFYVGGSTAESFLLSPEERKLALEIVAKTAQGKAKIIANIGLFSTEQGIDLAKHAGKLGVDAISSVPPFYFKYSINEYFSYYSDIADAVLVPMIIYNVPAMSGIQFSEHDFAKFFEEERIIGVKYTSYDLYMLQRLIARYPAKKFFIGHDEIFLSALATGVQAAIGSTMGFMPEKYIQIQRHFNDHNMEAAQKLQNEVNQVIAVLIKIGVLKGVKAALELQGIRCGQCRKPFQPLDANELRLLKDVLIQTEVIA
jgi:N-acetylneuraminate lyase